MSRRTLILEFNEVCPDLLARFTGEGILPNFAALRERSAVYTTWTEDPTLEPWTQWISYHYGVPETEHGVRRMNEGKLLDRPSLWDKLAEAGHDVLALGPMNSATPRHENIMMVPDPWTTGVEPTDASFKPICDFIRAQVMEHANPDFQFGTSEALRVLSACLGKGMRLRTVGAAVRQLLNEKRDSAQRWRRAMVLDWMLWDIYERCFPKSEKATGMIFIDATGHYQHKYWRQNFPEEFERETTAEEHALYGDAIRWGYRQYDRFIKRAMDMAGPDGSIILVGALSQQRNLRYESIGGRVAYKPRDFMDFVTWAGCQDIVSIEPVMSHQAWVVGQTPEHMDQIATTLEQVRRVDTGEPLLMVMDRKETRVFFGYEAKERVAPDTMIIAGNGADPTPFGELFASLGEVGSSKHCREGTFWVFGPGIDPGVRKPYLPLEEAHHLTLAAAEGQSLQSLEASAA